MELTENKKYIEELRDLLILEDKKPDKRRQERIRELRTTIYSNAKLKMDEISKDTIVSVQVNDKIIIPNSFNSKKEFREFYKGLQIIYRRGVNICKEAKEAKDQMRLVEKQMRENK